MQILHIGLAGNHILSTSEQSWVLLTGHFYTIHIYILSDLIRSVTLIHTVATVAHKHWTYVKEIEHPTVQNLSIILLLWHFSYVYVLRALLNTLVNKICYSHWQVLQLKLQNQPALWVKSMLQTQKILFLCIQDCREKVPPVPCYKAFVC